MSNRVLTTTARKPPLRRADRNPIALLKRARHALAMHLSAELRRVPKLMGLAIVLPPLPVALIGPVVLLWDQSWRLPTVLHTQLMLNLVPELQVSH